MSSRMSGTVLWFHPSSGRGMIRAENGRQFFFDVASAAKLDLTPGLRVEFDLSGEGGPVEARNLRYEGGQHKVAPLRKPSGKGTPTRKERQAARRSVAPKPPPGPSLAMKEGTMVNHLEWGPGHVVAATAHLVSVEFLSGVRKTFKPTALADLSGPDVPKAPTRRRRTRAAKETRKESGRRVIRRPKGTKGSRD